ncbi:MAG: DinB family protein [Candidatus Limnocylindrales bacterium]
MTTAADQILDDLTAGIERRPIPPALLEARAEILAVADQLREIPDTALGTIPWAWRPDGEDELRYGFYRIGELLEVAGIDAATAARRAGIERSRAADLIAPAVAARWDLEGLLLGIPDALWDAGPGGEEWTNRITMGHIIGGQRAYGVGSSWWLQQAYTANDPTLPKQTPDALWESLPSEDDEAIGAPAVVRAHLGHVLDQSIERLAGLSEDRLAVGARWSGFAVDIGFRLSRWSSHIREHTVQVEKTLEMLDHHQTEVDRLVRLILAAWGRAESEIVGRPDGGEVVEPLVAAVRASSEVAGTIRSLEP